MQQKIGRADMHMHTNVSDGASSVGALLKYVETLDLDVIAITDHDRLEASLYAYEHQDDYPFEVVPGVEVTSREGHVLAWWVTEPISAGMPLEDTVQAVHEAGGVAVLAHPFHLHVKETRAGFQRYWQDLDLIQRAGFDGVEVVNAGNVLLGVNGWAKLALRDLHLAYVGNSDAHTLTGIASASTGFRGKTAADLRRAIEARTTVPNGGLWSVTAYADYVKGVLDGSIVYTPYEPDTAEV
jgi:predicted metal-dependent phosphoesterase TrpH